MAVGENCIRPMCAETVEFIPDWLSLYVFLGLGDLAFTLAAFQCGAIELNPILFQAKQIGLFEFSKLALTLLVLCVGFKLRKEKVTEIVVSGANVMMAILCVYHVTLLYLYFSF